MLLTPFARFVSCRLQRALRLAICEPDHVYRIDHIRPTSNRNYHSRRNRHLAVATIDNLRGLPLRVIWAYPHLGLRVYVCPKRHRLSRAHLADGAACATKKRVLVSKVPSNVAQVRVSDILHRSWRAFSRNHAYAVYSFSTLGWTAIFQNGRSLLWLQASSIHGQTLCRVRMIGVFS